MGLLFLRPAKKRHRVKPVQCTALGERGHVDPGSEKKGMDKGRSCCCCRQSRFDVKSTGFEGVARERNDQVSASAVRGKAGKEANPVRCCPRPFHLARNGLRSRHGGRSRRCREPKLGAGGRRNETKGVNVSASTVTRKARGKASSCRFCQRRFDLALRWTISTMMAKAGERDRSKASGWNEEWVERRAISRGRMSAMLVGEEALERARVGELSVALCCLSPCAASDSS